MRADARPRLGALFGPINTLTFGGHRRSAPERGRAPRVGLIDRRVGFVRTALMAVQICSFNTGLDTAWLARADRARAPTLTFGALRRADARRRLGALSLSRRLSNDRRRDLRAESRRLATRRVLYCKT